VIDLHSHLLPGVDDGSKTVERSVAVLQEMVEHGVTDVCLTPHLAASRVGTGVPETQDRAFAALVARAPAAVHLHRGAEVMLDRPLPENAALLRGITLGGTRYILVEFLPRVAAQTVMQALTLVAATGLVPVLAHPERYSSCTPAAVRWWKETGAMMQVDATALISPGGRGERARHLLADGLADIAAADNHGDDRSLWAGQQALIEQHGELQADLLMNRNPRAILDDGPLTPVPPLILHPSLLQRLRGLLGRGDR
jgi:protein-tyrosine phosphatase